MNRILLVILIFMILGFAAGCWFAADSPTSPETAPAISEGEIDLDSPTGGLSMTDEEPAFGELEEFEALAWQTQIVDPIENTYEYQRQMRIRGTRIFDFRAIWGKLANPNDSSSAIPCPLDWSGTMHLEGGIISMSQAIAFEAGDSLYRVDASTIAWTSRTWGRFDGIHVKLIVPPPSPSDSSGKEIAPHVLAFSTGPFSRRFTVDELVALRIVEPVDECGNSISLVSFLQIPRHPRGQLAGCWELLPPDSIPQGDSTRVVLGRFRGVWIESGGRISGYMRGVFGRNSEGKRVFFGKYIDNNGHFEGILRGEYGIRTENSISCPHPLGWFAGEWLGENLSLRGKLGGHWMMDKNAGSGFFHGIWSTDRSDSI